MNSQLSSALLLKKLDQCLSKYSITFERERMLSNSFYEDSITLIPRPDQYIVKK
jgi:hypothetical protein